MTTNTIVDEGKKMRKRLIATLIVLLVCVSVGSVQAYTNKEYNFSIDPPSGWDVDDTVTLTVVAFYGPTEEGFRVSFNIQVESLSTNMTIEQYARAAKGLLQLSLDNYELISERARVINEVDAYEIISTFTEEAIDYKMKQVYLVKDKQAYVITYGALPTTYQKYLAEFESSVETFLFLGLDWLLWAIILVIVVGAVAVAVLVLRRRKPLSH